MIAVAPELHVRRGTLPRRELATFLREAQASIPLTGQVTVLLTTDAAVQELNRRFRRKNKPTDVLSFPSGEAPASGRAWYAGDLAISVPVAVRQAAEHGHPLLTEVKVLLLHGLLHLSGLDHEQDAGEMARRERVLRRQFALPAGLIQRSEQLPDRNSTQRAEKREGRTGSPRPAAAKQAGKRASR